MVQVKKFPKMNVKYPLGEFLSAGSLLAALQIPAAITTTASIEFIPQTKKLKP